MAPVDELLVVIDASHTNAVRTTGVAKKAWTKMLAAAVACLPDFVWRIDAPSDQDVFCICVHVLRISESFISIPYSSRGATVCGARAARIFSCKAIVSGRHFISTAKDL
jgi:hypothetical protein